MCTSKNNDSQDDDKSKKEKKIGFLAREEKENPDIVEKPNIYRK